MGGWQVDIQHLDPRKLLNHFPRRQSASTTTQSCFERYLQAAGRKRNKNMRLNTALELMVSRQRQLTSTPHLLTFAVRGTACGAGTGKFHASSPLQGQAIP